MSTDPKAWGIETGYHDMWGHWREPPSATLDAILQSMGASSDEPPESPVTFVRQGRDPGLVGPLELHTEDGGTEPVANELPRDLPLGYHRLVAPDGGERRLIVCPDRCFLPPGLRIWGWAVQTYALRSRSSWGFGDLADLRRLGEWSARMGAGMTIINPLHAADAQSIEPSPYFPGSRRWRNPLYVPIENVPGAHEAGLDLDDFVAQGLRLNEVRTIDRAAVYKLKSAALERIWERWSGDDSFDRFCRESGESLHLFATFVTLAERHGSDWREWPAELRYPDSPAVARAATEHSDRVRFHEWVQWLLDEQLRRASEPLPLVHDLAIGVAGGGADAWMWQDQFARGMTIGAPPDDFNLSGQNWGVLGFDPWRLRAAGYEPFIQTIRSELQYGGGLRYDHVMGLFRLFWIPDGRSAAEGTYVRYPFGDLLDIIALESQRANAIIIGEDLGTVEPFVREELERRAVLSYRLMWFEPGAPREFPPLSLAAVTNHDLPTIPGLWSGADIADQERAGVNPNYDFARSAQARLRDALGAPEDAPVDDIVSGAYRLLAEAPSVMLAATLEDALGVGERPNLPGTMEERSNWSLALPVTLEDIEEHLGPRRLAEILDRSEP